MLLKTTVIKKVTSFKFAYNILSRNISQNMSSFPSGFLPGNHQQKYSQWMNNSMGGPPSLAAVFWSSGEWVPCTTWVVQSPGDPVVRWNFLLGSLVYPLSMPTSPRVLQLPNAKVPTSKDLMRQFETRCVLLICCLKISKWPNDPLWSTSCLIYCLD